MQGTMGDKKEKARGSVEKRSGQCHCHWDGFAIFWKDLESDESPVKILRNGKNSKIDHSYFGFVVNAAVPPGMISAVYWSITGRE